MKTPAALCCLLLFACAEAPAPVPAPAPLALGALPSLSGDFGPYQVNDGPARIEAWSDFGTMRVTHDIGEAFALAIITSNPGQFAAMPPGTHTNNLRDVRLCSGPIEGQFSYDRVADDVTVQVTEIAEGKRYVISTLAISGDDVDTAAISFELVRE